MRILYLLIILILSTSTVSAQEGIPSIFTSEASAPPPLPSDENEAELTLSVRDIEQGTLLTNKHLSLELINLDGATKTNTLRYCGDSGNITLSLTRGNWEIAAKIDDFSTPGKDYISDKLKTDLQDNIALELRMLPVGSIKGTVYSETGQCVVNAKIKADCDRDYGETETTTDEFGTFSLDYAAVGKCRVSALSNDNIGNVEVNVTKGEIGTAEITLSGKTIGGEGITMTLIIIFIIVIAVALLTKRPRKKKEGVEIKPGLEKPETRATNRMQDIIKTLPEREQAIVNALIENDGQLSQADLCRKLMIPKATLSRDVYSLEQKKIIETMKIGREKEIRLTEWFMGGNAENKQ